MIQENKEEFKQELKDLLRKYGYYISSDYFMILNENGIVYQGTNIGGVADDLMC